MSLHTGTQIKMFLIENITFWLEAFSGYWGWIVAIVTGVTLFWRATRKTAGAGKNFFVMIRTFIDTTSAVADLKATVLSEFEQLRAENYYLNAKLEVLSDILFIPQFRADENGSFVDANEGFLEFFGLSIDDVTGDGWTQIFSSADRSNSVAAWDRATSRKINFSQIFRVKCDGGEIKTIKMRARPVFDGSRKFIEYLGSVVEIADKTSDRDTGRDFWKARELPPGK